MRGNETVSIEFLGSAEGAKRAANETVAATERVGAASQRTSSTVKKHAEEAVAANALLTGSFTRMASRAVAAGAGFTAAYIAVAKGKAAIAQTADLARETEILSRNTGLATKTTSAMLVTLKSLGVDTAGVSMSFQTLGRNIVQAEAGSKKTQAAFQALGITTKDLKAAHGDLNVLLPRIADGFGNLKGNADRLAVSQALLGRGYKSLLPLFADGAAGLQKQIDTAEQFGAVIDGKTLKQLERLHAAQVKNKEAALGLQIAFTQAATPALLGLSSIAQRVAKDFQGPGSLDDKLGKVGHDLGPALDKVEKTVEAAIPKIANRVGKDAPKVALAFVNGFENADVWGKLALGAFLLKKTGAWSAIFAGLGGRDAAAWGSTFGPAVEEESTAAGATAGERYSAAFKLAAIAGIAIAADAISQSAENAIHGKAGASNAGPNAGGRQDNTSGGQFSLSEWIAKQLGINQLKQSADNNLGQIIKGLGKSGGHALTGTAQRDIVNAAAQQFGIPAALLWGIYGTETGYGKNVNTSSAGAKGAFQFINDPATLKKYAYPYTNKQTPAILGQQALGAAHYISDLIKQKHGDVSAALLAYSGGGYSSVPGFNAQGTSYADILAGLNKKKAKGAPVPSGGFGSMGGLVPAGATLEWKRIDQGQDLRTDPGGALLALGNGQVVSVKNNPGGFGQGYPVVKFTSGPLKGREVYYGHTHSLLKAGAHFQAGQEITKTGYGTPREGNARTPGWAEIGFWGPNGPGSMTAGNAIAPFLKQIASGQYKANAGPTRISTGSISQDDVLKFMQSRVDHFDLMVQAGLLSGFKAALDKRKIVAATVPLLTGDNRLQALIALRALQPPPQHGALNFANSLLATRDSAGVAAQRYMTRAGIDPSSVAGLQFTGAGLKSRLGDDQKSLNFLFAGLWNAKNTGDKAGAKTITDEIKTVGDDQQQTLADIAQNTRDTAEAIKQGKISALNFWAGTISSLGTLSSTATGKGLISKFLPGFAGMDLSTGGVNSYLENNVIPGLLAQGDWPDVIGLLQQISDSTDQTAQNTQDLSDFWHQQALTAIQGFRVSQSQYGVLAGAQLGGMPFLGGFDAGGTVPGARGAAGLAVLHGGETVLPTHKQGAAPAVHVYVSAEARSLGVTVDHQIGRSARQRSVAPGH